MFRKSKTCLPASADEPEPTEKAPDTMAKRAAELRVIAMSAKEGREAALRAEAARFEEEKNEEAEKEKEPESANPDGASNGGEEKEDEEEEEEEEDSSESSTTSSEEEKEPESANPDGPILECAIEGRGRFGSCKRQSSNQFERSLLGCNSPICQKS